jgi:hypothetical protein
MIGVQLRVDLSPESLSPLLLLYLPRLTTLGILFTLSMKASRRVGTSNCERSRTALSLDFFDFVLFFRELGMRYLIDRGVCSFNEYCCCSKAMTDGLQRVVVTKIKLDLEAPDATRRD